MNTHICKLEYNNHHMRNSNEVKSKLLKPESELYIHLTKLKKMLCTNGFEHSDRMDLHTEILNSNTETLDIFLQRIEKLEGTKIDILDHSRYQIVGRSVGFVIGNVDGYKNTVKITIGFFPDNIICSQAHKFIIDNIKLDI